MSKKYVPDGVYLTCSCGGCYSMFKVTFNKVTSIYGSEMATEGDRWPYWNVKPFGVCGMRLFLCIPSPVLWTNVKSGVMIGSNQMLLEDSIAYCAFGGRISIHFTKEAAMAACPFGSFKKPSEYIKEGFDWAFDNIKAGTENAKQFLVDNNAPAWMLNAADAVAWNVEFSVGVVEGAINAVVGLGEVAWDITQDPVGIGGAIVDSVSEGASSAWDWASKGENWEKFGDTVWDYTTTPGKLDEAIIQGMKDAGQWIKDNPRATGNVAGEVLQTAAEIYFTAGSATAARASAKAAQELAEKAAKEIVEEAGEKAIKEIGEEAVEKVIKEAAEEGAEKTIPKVITNQADEAAEQAAKEAAEKTAKDLSDAKTQFDPKKASNKQKGNFGEMATTDNMVNNQVLKDKGYNLKRIGDDAPTGLDDKIKKGIDGIYENTTPPPKYVIDEAKYGSSELGKTADGKQMSDDWVNGSNRVEKQFPDTPEGRAKAAEIKDALDKGEVEKVVSKVDDAGNVTTYKVDADGKIGVTWP